ncbi:ABC transporter ATP-binding protein [Helicobacter aurati]|uniref:ABC transporter ATP-binding protein n=1 Tax=Helicobacter aurati TaxID=137778 RepID=A0A3D8J930_9HELI|nr:ABC transporter ATP-binding protein [Helicobacter aurati]RDU73351.1 ABC transporter ATP-binding protein [Helicobacter aurati]
MSNTLLKVDSITKSYDGILALSNVGFELQQGDIFGLLGRNGGGKTTLIKILTSTISDYIGNVTFLGYDLRDKSKLLFFKSHIAYLPDKDFLYGNMNGLECIRFFADFFADFSKDKALEICNRLEIVPSQKISTMSKGQAEKVGIALTLARKSTLYIFDEPLAGADVISRDEIFLMIQEYCSNAAVIIATHLISSVEAIVTKALFLNKKTMAYGDKESLLYGFTSLEDSFRYYAADHQIKPTPTVPDTMQGSMQ